jgi:hypothetical protein
VQVAAVAITHPARCGGEQKLEHDELALLGDAVRPRVAQRVAVDRQIERDQDLAAQRAEEVDGLRVALLALALERLAGS